MVARQSFPLAFGQKPQHGTWWRWWVSAALHVPRVVTAGDGVSAARQCRPFDPREKEGRGGRLDKERGEQLSTGSKRAAISLVVGPWLSRRP